MLQGYFDDSGTHVGADVVLWGGVLGDADQFARLEPQWRALLAAPLTGKPALEAFHSAHLLSSWGEYLDYRPAERDIVLKAFRDLILKARLVPVAFAVNLPDWLDVWGGRVSPLFGTAEQFAFLNCALAAARMATASSDPVRFVFDGDRAEEWQVIIEGVRIATGDQRTEFGFERVKNSVGLQAADLVAYESFTHALSSTGNNTVEARPHFQRLLEGAPSAYGFILRRKEIEALRDQVTAIIASGGVLAKSRRDAGFDHVFASSYRKPD
jgi:hypothetical protein